MANSAPAAKIPTPLSPRSPPTQIHRSRLIREFGAAALLLAAYFILGKLGLQLAFDFPSATPVRLGTGLALTAFLILGTRVWPAIFIGAFLVNFTTAGTVATSLGIAIGNTLEGVVGAWLVTRYAGGRNCLTRAEYLFKFTLLAALLSTMVSATVGVLSLHLAGLVSTDGIGSVWMTWWLGNASGDLLVAPVLLSWSAATSGPLPWSRRLELLVLYGTLVGVALALFGAIPSAHLSAPPLGVICIPFLVWAAVRFGPREAATATLLLGGVALWGTLQGYGPFVRPTPNASLILLQTYMGVASVMTLILAAAVAERGAMEAQLRELAISDPLTGIANYRHLISRLGAEIERAQRNNRPFAVLFLDVDGLKKINDRHGHIVGSRALCRVAEVLRAYARVIDTAARYGGDEFALLLPETSEELAWQVGRRITERLGADTETPVVRVSIGVAVHPRDGATPEEVLGAADRRLYAGRVHPGPPG